MAGLFDELCTRIEFVDEDRALDVDLQRLLTALRDGWQPGRPDTKHGSSPAHELTEQAAYWPTPGSFEGDEAHSVESFDGLRNFDV